MALAQRVRIGKLFFTVILFIITAAGGLGYVERLVISRERQYKNDNYGDVMTVNCINGPYLCIPYKADGMAYGLIVPSSFSADSTAERLAGFGNRMACETYTVINAEFAADWSALAGLFEKNGLDVLMDRLSLIVETDMDDLIETPSVLINGRESAVSPVKIDGNVFLSAPLDKQILYELSAAGAGPLTVSFKIAARSGSGTAVYPAGDLAVIRMAGKGISADISDLTFPQTPSYASISKDRFELVWPSFLFQEENFPILYDEYASAAVYDMDTVTGKALTEYAWYSIQDMNMQVYDALLNMSVYGFIILLISFLTMLAFQFFCGLRLHPVHHILTWLALILFSAILLSLAEFWNFTLSYAVSAAAVTALVSFYMKAVTGRRSLGAAMAGELCILYLYVYFMLVAEKYALLASSLFTLALLAAVMICTRHVDWDSLLSSPAPNPERDIPAKPAVQPARAGPGMLDASPAGQPCDDGADRIGGK